MSRRHLVFIAFASLFVAGCGSSDSICPGGAISCGQLCDGASAPSGCGDTCDMSTPCPAGLYCGADGTCTADCASDGDAFCPGDACTSDGQCVDPGEICPDGSTSCGQACDDVADAGAGNNLCGAACTVDGDCAAGYYCSDADTCTQDCSASNDEFCPVGECDSDGRCIDTRGMDGGNVCARQSVEATRITPNVILIIDRSGSMRYELDLGDGNQCTDDCTYDNGSNDCYCDGAYGMSLRDLSRWHALREALVGTEGSAVDVGLIGNMQDQVRFGAATFQGPQNSEPCFTVDNFSPVGGNFGVVGTGDPSGARSIIADTTDRYFDADNSGGTPTGSSIKHVLDNLDSSVTGSSDPTIFILATDGEPNEDNDCRVDLPGDDAGSDQESAVHAIELAYQAEVQTFVLAVADPADLSNDDVNEMANAGVGSAMGTTMDAPWWRIENVADLNTALSTIIEGQVSCTVDLQGQVTDWAMDPCSGGSVTIVQENGTRVPVSCDAANGWNLISEDQLRLNGTSCDTLKASAGATLDASFPCNTVIIIG